jgi:hypothetical protein
MGEIRYSKLDIRNWIFEIREKREERRERGLARGW